MRLFGTYVSAAPAIGGGLGLAGGAAATVAGMVSISKASDNGFFYLVAVVAFLFGLTAMWYAVKVLKDDMDAGERLSSLYLIPASLSGLALARMIIAMEFNGTTLGFLTAFAFSVTTAVLARR